MQRRDCAGCRHGHSRYLPCHAIPAKIVSINVSIENGAKYLFDLGMWDMWLYALGMQGCAVDGSGGEHGDGETGSVATSASE